MTRRYEFVFPYQCDNSGMSTRSPSQPVPAELVDAALQCFVNFGVRKTSLTDVANEAGVSRTTTYRTFGDKDGLVRRIVEAEVNRFVTALDTAVGWQQPLERALEEAVEFTLDYLQQHRLLQRVLSREPDQLTDVVIGQQEPASLVDLIVPAVVERFARTHHDLLRVSTEQAAEWLIRIIVSMLLNPHTRMPDPRTIAKLLLHGIIRTPGDP